MSQVKKAREIIQISRKFLNNGILVLAKSTSELRNFSMALKVFVMPVKLKNLSLFKKGSKTNPSNCRAIPLLVLLSKIFERVIIDQTEDFLKSCSKILYNYLSSFRMNHSTYTCLSF